VTPERLAVVSLAAAALALGVVAPAFGYSAVRAGLIFAVLAALVITTAVVLVRRLFRWEGAGDALIRVSVVAFALIVASTLVLGTLGVIGLRNELLLLTALLAAAVWITRSRHMSPAAIALPGSPVQLALGSALLCVVIAFGFLHSPLTAYDSLSYHLFFPARWLQEHQLSIIPTPFSDEAQAYAPANGELYYLWLMLPLGGDLLARIGQTPFLLLIGIALYRLAREAGAQPCHAIWPALWCIASRPIVEQAVGADVDLICWALFLCALVLGLRAARSDRASDWRLFGVAAGLYVGTKYVALVYAPVLLGLSLIGFGRGLTPRVVLKRLAWAAPGVVLFGLPWYLRNWIVAGSPLYPASLGIAGVTLARGAFSRSAMQHSVFHTTNVRLLPVMFAHAFGATLILCWLPLFVVGVWKLARKRTASAAWILGAPVAMTLLYWFGVPDNVDSRFMLPIAMLGLVPLALVFQKRIDPARPTPFNRAIHALYSAALLWSLIGLDREIPATLPWFMGGWLSLRGLMAPPFLLLTLALAGVLAVALYIARATRLGPAVLIMAIAVGAASLTRITWPWCAAGRCDYLQTTSIFLRPTFTDAWNWVDGHMRHATIAYTGNNVPYPLVGSHLANRVLYVNIDRHIDWRLHDYERAARLRLNRTDPGALATASGVLIALDPGQPRDEAVRPRSERMRGDRTAWMDNLRTLGVNDVFVSALSAYEIDFNHHDAAGFPIEDEWARADPRAFPLLYENAQVHIYAVNLGGGSR
jgi:hypothetical protein